ncbi:hypothetical protein B0H34DRAFT_677192 [Crassisporium funariophilum]|nr:hypothetical protein B0H34DRAFT_677192 [Crassisporium funariophilum]
MNQPLGATLYESDNQEMNHHTHFYFPDSASKLSIFKIEGVYYKVHRYFLDRESSVFQSMFSCPSPTEGPEGDSDQNPIHIPGVTTSEFEALLDFLYNGAFSSLTDLKAEEPAEEEPKTYAESYEERRWRELKRKKVIEDGLGKKHYGGRKDANVYDLLSISLRFEFDRITKIAVGIIDSLDILDDHAHYKPIERLHLAIEHEALRHWLLPAFNMLVMRKEALSVAEAQMLGLRRMVVLAREREKRLTASSIVPTSGPFGGGYHTGACYTILDIVPEDLLRVE